MKPTAPHEVGNDSPLPRLSYKIHEAAAILGVSPISVRRLIGRGILKPCHVLRHVLIPAEQLQALVTRN